MLTVVVNAATLLLRSASGVAGAEFEATLAARAVSDTLPPFEVSVILSAKVSMAAARASRSPREQEIVPVLLPAFGAVQLPPVVFSDTNFVPLGTCVVRTTFDAVDGPAFVTLSVYVSCDPEGAEPGPPIARRTSASVVPVPVKVTVCGVSYASSSKLSIAALAPVAVGTNATSTVHDPDDARVVPEQPSEVIAKSPGFAPVRETEPKAIGALPVSEKVTTFDVLVLPRAWLPKSTEAGFTVSGTV